MLMQKYIEYYKMLFLIVAQWNATKQSTSTSTLAKQYIYRGSKDYVVAVSLLRLFESIRRNDRMFSTTLTLRHCLARAVGLRVSLRRPMYQQPGSDRKSDRVFSCNSDFRLARNCFEKTSKRRGNNLIGVRNSESPSEKKVL